MADNEKMANDEDITTTTGSGVATNRDLGIAGGGTIPGSATSPGGTSTSNSTNGGGGTTDGDTTERENNTSNTGNTVDKHARGNLGGRNPSQPQIAMGDRDPRQSGGPAQADITDPMTSRDPSKIKQNSSQDKDSEHKD